MTQSAQMIGLGELLWDCFPEKRLPGGAPANVAFHAQQLGLTAGVATRVGIDALGDEICEFLVAQGISTEWIQRDPIRATGTVTITPNSKTDTNYSFLEDSAWDCLELNVQLADAIRHANAICFGTLAQRRVESRRTIQQCVQSALPGTVVVYDVNLRSPHFAKDWIAESLDRATVVKLNSDEVKVLSTLFDFPLADEIRFAKWLLDSHRRLDLVCVTRGAHGCMATTCQETIEFPGLPTTVVDTVGAGDAFTAAIIYGCLNKWPLAKTLDLANRFGSLVASHAGAMPVLKHELDLLKIHLDSAYRDTSI